jgi:predicted FMN-binding regulatory protein PaiB
MQPGSYLRGLRLMSYPPSWRHITDPRAAVSLMSAHPFAHLITATPAIHATRIPFATDLEDGQPVRLRAHLNGDNPQLEQLEGSTVLIVFTGRATYVSPHWRVDKGRAGTFDYEEVQLRGKARIVADVDFFRRLIDDLSALIEPQYADVGDYPVWQTSMAVEGYIERLFPKIMPFEIDIESVLVISKLHQHFPVEDRRSIAAHLARSAREDSRVIGEKILGLVDK